jgi:outer membrane protein assembly factor BamB
MKHRPVRIGLPCRRGYPCAGYGAKLLLAVLPLLLSGLLASAATSPNWQELRGPERNGHAVAAKTPISWSETNNVAWKTVIHDLGWSSPVIWGNQIWVATATVDGKQMFALCVDAGTGRILHDVKVFDTPQPEHVASMNSYASPTSAIEAGRVYVHYGTYGTACLDTRDGKILWSRRDLNCDHHEGPGGSLMLDGDLLFFAVDGRDVQYIVALNKATGETAWKTNRSVEYSQFPANCRKAFCTPILIDVAGHRQLISPGAKVMMACDPQTGAELWKVRYNGWSMVPRPLFGRGLLYVVNDYDRPELWAIKPDGKGDVTDSHVAWKVVKDVASTPSLLLIDDLLYMVREEGIMTCLEADTGKVVWRERLKNRHSASPIYSAGRIYLFSEKNLTTVMAPGREFKVLAENQLDERVMATPAVIGNALILRSKTHLYRLEEQPAAGKR